MDLIPKPDQLVAASANVAQKVFYGGVADLRPMPRTLIDDGELREVYHYRSMGRVKESGDPVLLVTPLAAPASCYDLRRGCSLVEHFVAQGRPTYLVEYGEVSFRNRNLGMEHWVTGVLPEAIRVVSKHAGGRPVHLIGWSLGGVFGLLTAAAFSSLPIGSLTTVGTPIDVTQVPLIAPVRPLLGLAGDRASVITAAYRVMGGIPKPVVRRAFQLSAFNKLVTKPFVQLAKLDDTDFLAQVEAVERFTHNMYAYPGRTFGQLYHRMVRGNELATGVVQFEGRDVRFSDIAVPVLAFGGASDTIAPVSCVRPIESLVTGAPDVQFEVVPGGHLGMLTGRAARRTTWPIMDRFIDKHSSAGKGGPRTRKKAAAKKSAPPKKAASGTAKKATGAKAVSDSPPQIGTNPNRRFSSAGSRGLTAARSSARSTAKTSGRGGS